ncbi:MAG: hypothetical protein ACRDJK_04255 [Actinomycetota bacterium]
MTPTRDGDKEGGRAALTSLISPGASRGWVPWAVIGAVLLVTVGVTLILIQGRNARPAQTPAELQRLQQKKFIPPTTSEGASTVMPITFPDGSTAEVVYDSKLGLAERGLRPSYSGDLTDCCFRLFAVDYELNTFVQGPELARFPGADGAPVPLRAGVQGDPDRYLVLKVGPWSVGVPEGRSDKLTDAQKATWAAGLVGRQTAEGFLVLEGKPPVKMTATGEASGPSLRIGSILREGIRTFPGACRPPAGRRVRMVNGIPVRLAARFGALCFADAPMALQIYGDEKFIRAVVGGIQIRNVKPPQPSAPAPPSP